MPAILPWPKADGVVDESADQKPDFLLWDRDGPLQRRLMLVALELDEDRSIVLDGRPRPRAFVCPSGDV
jgi:hypothetical protein